MRPPGEPNVSEFVRRSGATWTAVINFGGSMSAKRPADFATAHTSRSRSLHKLCMILASKALPSNGG
jgi:hypothetical protein